MKSTVCIAAMLLCIVTLSFAQIVTPVHHVYFETDRTGLTGNNTLLLDRVYEKLPEGRKVRIEIYGDVDLNQGVNYYNQVDQTRANAVLKYFENKGIAREKIGVSQRNAPWKRQSFQNEVFTETRFFSSIEIEKPVTVNPYDIEKLSALIKKTPEVRYLSNKTGGTFNFSDGTKIIFKANSFACATGGTMSDRIKLEVEVYASNSDIVVKDLLTKNGPKRLESGGMMHVVATCRTCGDNGKLILEVPAQVSFEYEGDYRAGMEWFRGSQDKAGNVDWNETGSKDISQVQQVIDEEINYNEDSEYWNEEEGVLSGYYNEDNNKVDAYLLEVTSLGWINCDRFPVEQEKQDVFVQADGKIRPYVRIVFPKIKSVMAGTIQEKRTKTTNGVATSETLTYSIGNVPKGRKAILIAYSVIDKQAYFAKKEIVIGSNATEEITPQKMPLSRVKELLAQLD